MLEQKFQRYLEQNGLGNRSLRILLTVSGGVDSMVLFSLFLKCGYDIGVAHCNFQLRGEESDEDEMMVRRVAREAGVPCHCRSFETQEEMERTGESMEMAARRLRYDWFEELRATEGYDRIALAHHADDSIETFFINLLRGTGLRGLTGITARTGFLVRPLIFASRREISEYAAANRIPYREDSSNRSTKYLRNKIRLGLVPRIREINPKFTLVMRRNIGRLEDAQFFIDRVIGTIRRTAVSREGGIDRIRIGLIDPELPRNFVIYELLNSGYGFKGDVVDALCRALDNDATGKRFYARAHVACIDRGDIVVAPVQDDDPCEVEIPEGAFRAYCGNSVLYFERCDVGALKEFGVPEHLAQIDADKLRYPLVLRRWQEGDSFIPFGMTGHSKLSDFLKDRKVSPAEKQRQFVLVSGGEIVWVVGHRIDDRYRITRQTENVLRILREVL